jgi:MtrB/PioB family decaheme-associated outer membrane protein
MKGTMNVRVLVLAVQGVLAAMAALPVQAQEETGASLKVPPNSVEIEVLNVSGDSYKFGEYTGLKESGAYVNGGFGIRGGDGYGDENGTRRWELWGTDLGLTSRSLGGSVGDQGRWNLGLTFDQLTHYTSDSYQTPYSGNMGGNSFTLPSFGLVTDTRAMSAGQKAQFQTMKISNDRQNTSLTGGFFIDRQWNIKVDFNHLEQSGARLMGFGSSTVGGAGGERISILPMPLNYTTDTATAALNWIGDKAHMTASYFGSFFRDNYNGVSFQTWNTAVATQTMGTAPSNTLHQLNLTGGYALAKRTKLAGGLSYGYNTQNSAYAYDTAAMATPSPTSSLNGAVKTTHADLKLTDQTTRDLALSAGLKYDHRDNRTASNIYNFRAIDGSVGNTANYPNAPFSIRKTQLELAGDYRLSAGQKVRLAYNHDDTHRWCNDYATGGGTPAYAPGTNCVTVPRTKEDKIGAGYRLRATDGVSLNAGYSYSERKSDRDTEARPPMIGRDGNPTAATIAAAPPGTTGLNGGEFLGFNPFFEASRKQHMLKAGTNWEPVNDLSLGFSGRYTHDGYDTTYGMQTGQSWGLNFDSTYRYREEGAITAYATYQQRRRDMTNLARSPVSAPTATVPPGGTWNNELRDTDTTVGLNAKQGGLAGGKVTLTGDLTYSYAKSFFDTSLNYDLLSGAPCSSPAVYTCVGLPDIKSTLLQFKLKGDYQVTKSSKATVGYLYQRLKADDFYYNGLQIGSTPTSVLPTSQSAPSYAVNVFFANWIYNF